MAEVGTACYILGQIGMGFLEPQMFSLVTQQLKGKAFLKPTGAQFCWEVWCGGGLLPYALQHLPK